MSSDVTTFEPRPDGQVPDAFYLASLDHAKSPDERRIRDVLAFHRHLLCDGLGDPVSHEIEKGAGTEILASYRHFDLEEAAEPIERAFELLTSSLDDPRLDDFLDELVAEYVRIAYGEPQTDLDAIELALGQRVQANPRLFGRILRHMPAYENLDWLGRAIPDAQHVARRPWLLTFVQRLVGRLGKPSG